MGINGELVVDLARVDEERRYLGLFEFLHRWRNVTCIMDKVRKGGNVEHTWRMLSKGIAAALMMPSNARSKT